MFTQRTFMTHPPLSLQQLGTRLYLFIYDTMTHFVKLSAVPWLSLKELRTHRRQFRLLANNIFRPLGSPVRALHRAAWFPRTREIPTLGTFDSSSGSQFRNLTVAAPGGKMIGSSESCLQSARVQLFHRNLCISRYPLITVY